MIKVRLLSVKILIECKKHHQQNHTILFPTDGLAYFLFFWRLELLA
ncbi:hypothetical protein CFter6_0766 [Collimonas fungivorans]|uniref:Uncharacterized protein n=1 Tax=Collimonas fungivorans TaxID=158899 RepID=A0A127P7S6_9BURK|nr:hypothetical protein CFter6_0766 [Collimonas fungivorans]